MEWSEREGPAARVPGPMTGGERLLGSVLAGGEGRRMGGGKAWLPVGGVPMVLRVVRALAPVVEAVAVVGPAAGGGDGDGDDGTLPATVAGRSVLLLRDRVPDRGPLEGLAVSLAVARERGDAAVLVLPCDMPLVDAGAVRALVEAFAGDFPGGALLLRVGPRLQPLAGVYRVGVLPAVEAALAGDDRSARGLAASLDVRVVTPEALGVPADRFANVNTPAERARAERAAACETP